MDQETYDKRLAKQKENRIKSFNRHLIKQKDSPMYRKREYLNQIRISNRSGSYENHFRFYPNNTPEHEDMKYKVFEYLRRLGHSVMVECIFLNGSRCDVLDLTAGICYEVRFTETEEECIEKMKNYPEVFDKRMIDAHLPFNPGDILA